MSQEFINGDVISEQISATNTSTLRPDVSVQTVDIADSEPISLHFKHAEQIVNVKAGSIASGLTLFIPKRNEVFNVHIPPSEQVSRKENFLIFFFYLSLLLFFFTDHGEL